MGKRLSQVLAGLSPARRKRINQRFGELRDQVESLRQLRELAERSQQQMASALGVKQPSVSKMERQADMYLSTLREFVEAAGGKLDLVVRFPNREPVRLKRLGEVRDKLRA